MSMFRHLVFAMMLNASSVEANIWDDDIAEANRLGEFYLAEAISRGAPSPGTAYASVGADERKCSILGRFLRKSDAIKHFERITKPIVSEDMSSDEIDNLVLAGVLFSEWAESAKYFLKMADSQRIEIWNLDCVGNLGIKDDEYIGKSNEASGQRFLLDGVYLKVIGDIDFGFFVEFEKIIRENPDVAWVELGSAGGSVLDAINSGMLIRENNLSTSLGSNCYSACPLIFIGGSSRIIYPNARLGFHRVSVQEKEVSFDDPIYQTISDYVYLMGVDSDFYIKIMQSISSRELFYPTYEELCSSQIATSVYHLC